jgi:cytochrome c biogenesis protein CcmG/thiol:disulfide interchange protein DsbE
MTTDSSPEPGNTDSLLSEKGPGPEGVGWGRWIPLGIFGVLVVFLAIGLTKDPRDVPPVLIDKPAPRIQLPDLFDLTKQVDSSVFDGQVWLLNVWGTWCPECWREHEFLNYLAREEGVPIFAIDWRDEAGEARSYLASKGNPFRHVGFDPNSKAVVDWGVYGAPETFLIDPQGRIRWKWKGALNQEVWESQLKPLMQQLEASR